MGCDTPCKDVLAMLAVSIHAPVWGATGKIHELQISDKVSIHAPVWGATPKQRVFCAPVCFNPRTRVGCDRWLQDVRYLDDVSIHAPVWGATITTCKGIKSISFQSTHPCGVRRLNAGKLASLVAFQSTHPCGVRQQNPSNDKE